MLAEYIPAKVRKVIYSVLGTAVGLEAIFDIVPDVLEGKLLAALVVLGFGLALKNTTDITVVSDEDA
jgi:hypothetical protein